MAPSSPRPAASRTVTTRPFSAHARRAALELLSHARFDVLIIGGGITGAGVARDAAMRGLRTALVERDDFASGTSSRSSRLIHGGLRYLEHGWLHLVFESSRERRTLMRIAPHLVRPLAFTWPVYDEARVPLWKLGAGLMVYDALALFRNLGGNHRRLLPAEVLELEPAIRRDGLHGGARYFDASTNDVRLTLANVRAAVDEGATVMNHAEVRTLRRAGSHVTGAHVVDRITGKGVDVTARAVVNATGPWSDSIRRMVDRTRIDGLAWYEGGPHRGSPRPRRQSRRADGAVGDRWSGDVRAPGGVRSPSSARPTPITPGLSTRYARHAPTSTTCCDPRTPTSRARSSRPRMWSLPGRAYGRWWPAGGRIPAAPHGSTRSPGRPRGCSR